MMRGVGEILSAPVPLPALHAVLVNPGVAVPTADVFTALAAPPLAEAPQPDDFVHPHMSVPGVLSAVGMHRNDLEDPAIGLQPIIDGVLTALRESEGCRLARMSGSGATCFGIFHNAAFAQRARGRARARQPGWWVRATVFGS